MITACIIFRDKDADWLRSLLSTIPNDIKVICVKNQQGSQVGLNFVKEINNRRFYDYTYTEFSFSECRNAAISQAKTEWIVSIDTDEYVSLLTWNDMKQLVKQVPDKIGGVFMGITGFEPPYANYIGGWYVCDQVRLFRNKPNIEYEGYCHEQIIWSLGKAGYSLTSSSLLIQHLGYPDAKDDRLIYKADRNFELLNKDLFFEKDTQKREYYKKKTIDTSVMINILKGLRNG